MKAVRNGYLKKAIRLLCASVLCIAVPTGAFADRSISSIVHRVNVALSIEAPFDLITHEAYCENDKICNVISNKAYGIDMTLELKTDNISVIGYLTVRCQDECSFVNGKSAITFRGNQTLDLFEGEDRLEIPLVSKPRTKIGKISLLLEELPP